ncbi:hypothetical protein Hypma_010703 [Hypsizygus marmoreus]|uniref:Uncharacterized protein n=1 Tax=Hypsizygus marmoreus TaxID=39966 RepID=A0A369JJ39_HYPMA|nr:hypothetical protein Hypma_010703 [Hypsizygus marmoreus]
MRDIPSALAMVTDDATEAFAAKPGASSRKSWLRRRPHSPPPCYIAQLPEKILFEIFMLHCLPPRWDACSRAPPAPMVLSHVCRQWRLIALSLPILWSWFSPAVWRAYAENPAPILLVQLWLERSRGCPLALNFGPERIFPATRLLFPNIHRWGSFDVILSDDIAKDLVNAPLENAFLLERLDVTTYSLSQELHDEWADCLPRLPNLRRLAWKSSNSPELLLQNAPWSSLTHIELFISLSMKECVSLLGLCTQAMHIGIGVVTSVADDITSVPTMLPRLAYLRVQLHSDAVGALLRHFTLPSLRTLRFNTLYPSTTRQSNGFEDFVLRSSCVLEILHIHDVDLHEDDLVCFLGMPCLQSLREFKVTSKNMTQRTLSRLIYPNAPGVEGIFPHLERLHLEYIRAPDGLLSDMIASRWRPVRDNNLPASLQNVGVVPHSIHSHGRDRSHLKKFAEQGLWVGMKW